MAIPTTTLRLRGKTYYLDYTENGVRKRFSLRTDNLQVAKEKQRQFESTLVRGGDNPLPTETPLDDALQRYIEEMRSRLTAAGFRANISYLRRVFGPVCDDLKPRARSPRKYRLKDGRMKTPSIEVRYVEQITTMMIADFLRARADADDLKPKTMNRYREVLQRFFNWAMEEGGLRLPGGINPAKGVKRRREGDHDIRFLRKEDIAEQLRILEARPLFQAMVATYIYAGLRREELLWLQKTDVILKPDGTGIINVVSKTVGDQFWEPKTKRHRSIPISKALRYYLDQYQPRSSIGNWFFPTTSGSRWHPDNFSEQLRKVNRASGLPWGCADFRHTFGSQLAMKNESLYKISTLMGNSPEVCRKHYARLLPESLVNSVEFDEPRAETPQPKSNPVPGRPHLRLIVNNEE